MTEEPRAALFAPQILVLDDDASWRSLVRRALERAGFVVLPVATGLEAVEAFLQHRATIRMVLTDVALPGSLDGLQTMTVLRALRPGLPFCLLTAQGGEHTAGELLAAGPSHLFLKPFRLADLVEAVSKMLRPTE